MAILRTLVVDEWRLLSFRPMGAGIAAHPRAYLAFGLVFTWLAGVGRYWDNPRANLFQHLGLGSVAYVFCLAAMLWVLLLPLRPRHWSYRNVLVFVALTAPPAVLYAIPVERFMTLEAAQSANIWFLAVVATWRVALLFVFLRRVAKLDWLEMAVSGLLPLTMIVAALTALNLEHVVFELMGGLAPEQRSSNDGAYHFVLMLTFYSVFAFPVLLLAWIFLLARVKQRVRDGLPAR